MQLINEQIYNLKLEFRLCQAIDHLEQANECLNDVENFLINDGRDIWFSLRSGIDLTKDLLTQARSMLQ